MMRLLLVVAMAATACCQLVLYPNGTQSATTLSPGCATAISASLTCDPYLQGLAETNYYGSLNDDALQASICEPSCGSALAQYHSVIVSSCSNDPQPWDGIPATWAGDALWATWNRTCLKDPKTGGYCNDFIATVQNNLTQDSDVTALPQSQLCSPCLLSLFQSIQSTSFSNYNDDLAVSFQSAQKICQVDYPTDVQPPVTNVTSLPGYVTGSTNATCLSGVFYSVAPGDDCQKIAAAKQVATGTLRIINNILPDCSNLIAGAQICIPQPCTTYLIQPDDTCWSIASANNIYASTFIAYNPSINPDCTNLLSGETACLSPAAGIYTPTLIAGATVTQTGSYASATVSPPGPTPYGTTPQCGKYYQCNPGDNCQQISLNSSITLSLFEAINPNINAGCSNLVPGYYYCVFPTQDWNATATGSNGTTVTSVYVTAPAPTPTDTTNDCYTWHIVVSGDTCSKIETTYGITFAQFQDWNPSIDTACVDLLLDEAYCVSGLGSTSVSATATK